MKPVHEVLKDLGNTKSQIEKVAILKKHDSKALRLITYYANHPLKHFFIKQLPWSGKGVCTLEQHLRSDPSSAIGSVSTHINGPIHIPRLLDKLSYGKLRGQEAKSQVKEAIEALTFEDGEVLKKVLKKDLRCGVKAKTTNKAFGEDFIPIFGCMLASAFKGINVKGYYMSLKYDGLRGKYLDGIMYTRNGHIIQGIEHITKELLSLNINSLDGELLIPGEHFQISSGQIRSTNSSINAMYHVFDTAELNIPFKDRLQKLQGLAFPECIKVVKHSLIKDNESVDRNFEKALNAGYEGLVLKSPNHLYKQSRSKDWLKMKAEDSIELLITGLYEGEGKWKGMAGGCICQYKDTKVRASSGRLSDDNKKYVWEHSEEYIGKKIEVLFHEITPTGSLRHPRMKSKCVRGDI